MSFTATWVDRDYHTKWSKSDREKQIWYDIIYIWDPKWYEWTYLKTEVDSRA